ncbi:MAG TPA: HAD-IA family hydrolase [Candidatus Saccharimonadales bacterium]|nr:HAD-IA family hydrolase [Candidatus Saccharimonadales bacterium]
MAAIIFDFDGTVADSFEYIADFLAYEAGLEPLTKKEKEKLRGQSMAAIGRKFGISWIKLIRLFFKGRSRMHIAMSHVEPFEGMPEVIEKLHAEGHELFMLSSNTVRNIHAFLHNHGLYEYFLQIYGGIGLFGKAPSLRRLLRDQQIDMENAVYVGDELRDVQSAKSIGLRVVAVTWGFARPSALKSAKPTALASSPKELLKALEEL